MTKRHHIYVLPFQQPPFIHETWIISLSQKMREFKATFRVNTLGYESIL